MPFRPDNRHSQLYYEAVAMSRRTLLVAMSVVLFVDTRSRRYSVLAFLNLFFLTLHTHLRPFTEDIENTLEVAFVTLCSDAAARRSPELRTTLHDYFASKRRVCMKGGSLSSHDGSSYLLAAS